MFNDITVTLLVITILAAVGSYLILKPNKRLLPASPKVNANSIVPFSQPAESGISNLIDRPGFDLFDGMTMTIDRPAGTPEQTLEIEEDEETHLLKAAEMLVEKVQEVVDHIASNPPNPEEVFTKIRAIVNPYTIFHQTDYFDAINSFIAVTVERDCGITFTKDELLQLWN